jgi:hypothetical protein
MHQLWENTSNMWMQAKKKLKVYYKGNNTTIKQKEKEKCNWPIDESNKK